MKIRDSKKTKNRGAKLQIVLCALVLLGALVYALTDFLTDLLWFREVGYVSVFLTEIWTKVKLGIPTFIVIAMLMQLFLSLLKKSFLKKADYKLTEEDSKKTRKVGIVLNVVFSVLITVSTISGLWWQILQFINATEFGVNDPLYGNDIGFYVFKLEFLQALNASALQIAGALLVSTLIYYAVLIGISAGEEGIFKDGDREAETLEYDIPSEESEDPRRKVINLFTKGAGRKTVSTPDQEKLKKTGKAILTVAGNQICLLGVIVFVLIGLHFLLARFNLLYSGTGVAYGAGYTDINVTLNMYRALIALTAVSAVLFVLALKKKSIKLGAAGPILMCVVFAIGTVITGVVQNIIVAPDEINKESKYLQNNIDYTRMAYNLQDIEVKDFSANGRMDIVDVLENMGTLSNIRINDFDPANQFYNQTQSIRSYYTFNDVDVDRYMVNGEYTQVFLSAREIDQSRIENQWLINHLKYTHGYGITLSRVDKVTASGQPDMLIDSIPPVSEVAEIQVTRPEIYFGESTNGYVITNTSESEFDYPSGESNMYCTYEGTAGINLSPFNRLLFAIRERSLKMLVSTNINSGSRILIYRNIVDRVEKIAPFLTYDDDPYVVAADGRIYWMINAYTTSSYYPYSEPIKGNVNYIRNSVKVVIDAYNGDISFYICDENDPLAATLSKIYPGMFRAMDEMPENLKAHVQYPNAMFLIQAEVFQKYHMTDVAVFYQNEDKWSIANEFYGQSETAMTPNYFIMKLPGEDEVEFVSSLPYTPSGKNNMTGLLMARSDGDNYGELILYRMPKDRTIYGPAQIEAQINQDAEISKEFSLWNNSGSKYSRGNLYVLPVADSLLYVEPIYLESSSGSLPEVKRVVMYYGDKVAYESTLAECLDSLFGKGAGDPLNTENPIEAGREAAAIIAAGGIQPPAIDPGIEIDPDKPPQPDGGDDNYLELANEAYEKAMEYLELMKEYLDKASEEGI